MRKRTDRASSAVSRQWLRRAAATDDVTAAVTAEVQERLADLPSALHLGAQIADAALGALPEGLALRLCRLPVASEYARMVESLTAVSYFDAISRDAPIPAPRTGGTPVDAVESRA